MKRFPVFKTKFLVIASLLAFLFPHLCPPFTGSLQHCSLGTFLKGLSSLEFSLHFVKEVSFQRTSRLGLGKQEQVDEEPRDQKCSRSTRILRGFKALGAGGAISESEVWCPGILMFPRVVLPWTEGSYCLNTSRSDFPISCFNYRIRPCRDRQTSHRLLHGCTKSSKNIDQCPGNNSLFVPVHKEALASLSLICKKRRTSTLL